MEGTMELGGAKYYPIRYGVRSRWLLSLLRSLGNINLRPKSVASWIRVQNFHGGPFGRLQQRVAPSVRARRNKQDKKNQQRRQRTMLSAFCALQLCFSSASTIHSFSFLVFGRLSTAKISSFTRPVRVSRPRSQQPPREHLLREQPPGEPRNPAKRLLHRLPVLAGQRPPPFGICPPNSPTDHSNYHLLSYVQVGITPSFLCYFPSFPQRSRRSYLAPGPLAETSSLSESRPWPLLR